MSYYPNFRGSAPGQRRASAMLKSGGYVAPQKRADGGKIKPTPEQLEEIGRGGEELVRGKKAGGRLDKMARGGIAKITPSKRKPHVAINVINASRPPRRGLAIPPPIAPVGPLRPPGVVPPPGPGAPPMMGGAPPMRPPGMKRGGLAKRQEGGPLIINAGPGAAAARPGIPPVGTRPFGMKRGGRYGGGRAGAGSGEGRLELSRHMKGK